MNNEEELLTANLILPLIKDLVLPKIESIVKKFSIKTTITDNTELNIAAYLSRRYEKFLIIDTLVFPNKQTIFKRLYEPLTLIAKNESRKSVEIKINDYSDKFLPKYIRAIIEDTAGMGKSTITKKLFLSAIEKKAGIPILIELRQINPNNNFLKELQNQLSPIGKLISIDIILKLFSEGGFIFLFDGFDEISKIDKEFVIKDLHNFIEKANDNYFLITSRQEDSLVSFGDFQKFSVKPLTERESYSLINRYDTYSFKPIAKDLIKKLKVNKDETLKEFLSNPFLVSLLYKSFEYKKDIPIKKSQFYRQVYDALFESHDLSKEGYLKRDKYSNLHLDDFERILRYIGYFTSIENKVEYDKDYVINIIDKVKKYNVDLTFKSSDYLKDLLETVPLFKRDGNYIKWAHKSLQDYFAAKFIWIDAKENQKLILKKIYDDYDNKRFYNVLDLFFELDPNLFDETILLWLLEDFEVYKTTHYQNFSCIKQSLLNERIAYNFHKNCTIAISKKEDFDTVRIGKSTFSEYYKSKIKNSHIYNKITYNYIEEPKVVVLTFIHVISNIETILELISYRIPNIAKFTPHKIHLKELKLLNEDEVYVLDDNIDNQLNNELIFDIVNDLILSDHTIDFDNATKKLEELRLSKHQNDHNEFTEW